MGSGPGPAWEGQISTTITATSTRLRLDQAALLRATLVYYTCTMIDALVYILDDQEPADIYSSLGSEVFTKGYAPLSAVLEPPCLLACPKAITCQPSSRPPPICSFCSCQASPSHLSSLLTRTRVAVSSPRTIISTTDSISTPPPTPSTTCAHPTATPSHPTPPTPPTPPSQTSTNPPPSQTLYADSSAPAAPPR